MFHGFAKKARLPLLTKVSFLVALHRIGDVRCTSPTETIMRHKAFAMQRHSSTSPRGGPTFRPPVCPGNLGRACSSPDQDLGTGHRRTLAGAWQGETCGLGGASSGLGDDSGAPCLGAET